jgi:hypothetical protein
MVSVRPAIARNLTIPSVFPVSASVEMGWTSRKVAQRGCRKQSKARMQSFRSSPMVAAMRAANTTDTAFTERAAGLGTGNRIDDQHEMDKGVGDEATDRSSSQRVRVQYQTLETAAIDDHSLRVGILGVGGHVDRSRPDGHSTVALYQ